MGRRGLPIRLARPVRPRRGLTAGIFAVITFVVALLFARQRRTPVPLPPFLTFLLENPVTAAVVGPETLLDRAGLATGMRVLDAGCGPGRLSILAARRVGPTGEVVALDGQEAMLDKLRKRLESPSADGCNVKPRRGLLGTRDLNERDVYDRVILAMVLGEIRDRGRALGEIHDALKPGGILSVTEVIGDPDYHGRTTVRREAESAGFELDLLYDGWISFTMNFRKPG